MAYVLREIESPEVWDSFVHRYAPMALFQGWKWGEVAKASGHTSWRFGWFAGETLVAAAQVQKVTARRGTFLHVRHGPVLREQKKSLWSVVLADLKTLAKKEHAWFIRVSPLLEITQTNKQLYKTLGLKSAPIHAMDAEYCWVLDLDKSEDELLAGMRKTTRYEIKRAQKMSVLISVGEKESDLKRFNTLYELTSARHNFVRHTGITEEFKEFSKSGDAFLLFGLHEGETIASALILFWGDQAIYHHGASVQSKIPASYLVQWEAIREAKKRGKMIYNFWGIAPNESVNHPWRGITLFKTGFGGRPVEFMHAADYPVSPLYVLPKTIEGIRKRLKGY